MTFYEFLLSIAIVAVPGVILHWLGVPAPWWLLAGPLAAFVWFVAGCMVLSAIDDDDGALFQWAQRCPLGYTYVLMAWPAIYWAARRRVK